MSSCSVTNAYFTRTFYLIANNCNYNAPDPTPYITRDGSTTVALRARYERYQVAGGCWNDNDRDDSPGDPTEDPNTGGEGGDCSGFTSRYGASPRTRATPASTSGTCSATCTARIPRRASRAGSELR